MKHILILSILLFTISKSFGQVRLKSIERSDSKWHIPITTYKLAGKTDWTLDFMSIANALDSAGVNVLPSGGTDGQVLVVDGDGYSWQDLPSNLILFATNVDSDISTYKKLVTSIDDPDYNDISVDISTGAITGSNQLVASLSTNAGVFVGNPGLINISTIGEIKRVSGSASATFYFKMYKRDSGGTETLIATSDNTLSISNSVYEEFSTTALLSSTSFLSTDRIVLKFYGSKVGGGSNPTFNFLFGGSNPVRTTMPVPVSGLVSNSYEIYDDGIDGVTGKIYLDTSNAQLWLWNGSEYISNEVNTPWVKVGDTIATSMTEIGKDDDIFRDGFVSIGPNSEIETQVNESVIIKTNDEDVALRLKTDTSSTEFKPLVFDYSNINSSNFPNFDFRASRFDGINGIDPLPNVVTRMGYNAGSGLPPTGQIKLETAYEYYYNLQNANPLLDPEIVSEWHVEFTPLASSGKPIQRWISWAGRHDGSYTSAQITGDLFNLVRADNTQILKIEEQGDQVPSTFRWDDGVQFISQNIANPYCIFANGININGQGRIFANDGESIKIGKVGNQNDVVIYGNPNGTTLRLTSAISTQTWEHSMWAGGYLFKNTSTGASPIVIENAAADSSIRLKSNRVEVGLPITLSQTFPTNGSGAQNGSLFKGTDGALYYKGGSGTVTLIAPN